MLTQFNQLILNQASKLDYIVKDTAPNDIQSVLGHSQLVIWSGQSDNTIWQDAKVNHAFRALHDALHIESRLGFTPLEEIELGRIQASKYSGLLADLVYCEVSKQAEHYLKHGTFLVDQVGFTLNYLRQLGHNV